MCASQKDTAEYDARQHNLVAALILQNVASVNHMSNLDIQASERQSRADVAERQVC